MSLVPSTCCGMIELHCHPTNMNTMNAALPPPYKESMHFPVLIFTVILEAVVADFPAEVTGCHILGGELYVAKTLDAVELFLRLLRDSSKLLCRERQLFCCLTIPHSVHIELQLPNKIFQQHFYDFGARI